jgi:hypothetical protein
MVAFLASCFVNFFPVVAIDFFQILLVQDDGMGWANIPVGV